MGGERGGKSVGRGTQKGATANEVSHRHHNNKRLAALTVRHAHEVAVPDGRAHLEHEPRRLRLGVPVALLLVQPVKQLAAVAELQDEVDVVRVLVVLVLNERRREVRNGEMM